MNYSPVQLAAHKEHSDPDAAAALEHLASALECVSDLPVSANSAKQAQRELFELWEATGRLRVEALRRLTAVTESGLSSVLYASDMRYVAHQQHITNSEASKQLGLASFLSSNTASAKAVLNADISLGHADALASAWRSHRDEFADVEKQLLDAVPGRDVDSFQKLVRQWEWRLEKNGAGDAATVFDKRSLTAQSMLDGSTRGSFHLTAEQAEILFGAIETVPDPIDGVVPARTLRQRRADALIEALTGETDTNTDGYEDDDAAVAGGPGDVCGCAEPPAGLGPRNDSGEQRSGHGVESDGGRRVKIDAVIDIQTLGGLVDGEDKQWTVEDLRSELHRSGDLPPAVIAQLMCDASFRRIIFDGPNVVLAYNRATPLIPPALRRAVQIRDRRCVVAGCDRSHLWCDVHHLVERSKGGKTEEANLGLVCRRHHSMLHLGQIVLSRNQQTGVFSTSLP